MGGAHRRLVERKEGLKHGQRPNILRQQKGQKSVAKGPHERQLKISSMKKTRENTQKADSGNGKRSSPLTKAPLKKKVWYHPTGVLKIKRPRSLKSNIRHALKKGFEQNGNILAKVGGDTSSFRINLLRKENGSSGRDQRS